MRLLRVLGVFGMFLFVFTVTATGNSVGSDLQAGDQENAPAVPFAVQYMGQSESTVPWMAPGQTRVEWVDYKNVGTATWDNTGGVSNPNYMELRSVESSSPCVLYSSHCAYHSSWINRQRVTNVMRNPATGAPKTTNPPGQIARYQFTVEADGTTGSCWQYTVPWATPGCMGNHAYFLMQVDGNSPSVPANIAAYPPSSSDNWFAFAWDPSDDFGQSGVSGYYWKINNGPENFVPGDHPWIDYAQWAEFEGDNTFYVRAVDNVGNSSGYNFVVFNYFVPTISVSPESFEFTVTSFGALPSAQNLLINNIGTGTLNWTVSDDATWLDVIPSSGSGNSQSVSVSVNTSGLPENIYYATISVTSDDADNSPVTISVAYDVGPDCRLVQSNYLQIDSVKVDGISKTPDSLAVDIGATLRFYGSGADINEDSVLVYDGMRRDSLETGLFWIYPDRCGRFTYPPESDTANSTLLAGFFPMWFSTEQEATPLIVVSGGGCMSCSVDSIVAAINRDTSMIVDAIGIPSSTNDSLSFPIFCRPINQQNLTAAENAAFWRGFRTRYVGPVDYAFLANAEKTGWLDIGEALIRQRTTWVSDNMPDYFQKLQDSSITLAIRDSSGILRLLSSDQLKSGFFKNKWNQLQIGLRTTFDVAMSNLGWIGCSMACAVGLGNAVVGNVSGVAWCAPLLQKVVTNYTINEICNSASDPNACKIGANITKTVSFGSITRYNPLTAPAAAICDATSALEQTYKLSKYINSGQAIPTLGQSSYNRNANLIRSYSNTRIPVRRFSFAQELNDNGSAIDSEFIDITYSLIDPPDFSISLTPDLTENPSDFSLLVITDVPLFQLTTDSLVPATISLVNSADTVVVGTVTIVDDTTYSAVVPISAFPNYVVGSTYSAELLVAGYDLFSNQGEEVTQTLLGTISIGGGTLEGEGKVKFTAPPQALQGPVHIVVVPATIPGGVGTAQYLTVKAGAIDTVLVLGQPMRILPNGYEPTIPCSITLPIDSSFYELQGSLQLFIARYDSLAARWIKLPTSISTQDGTASAPVTVFGIFASVAASPTGPICCIGTSGDVNGDGTNANILDLTYLVDRIFRGGPPANCPEEADVNGDGNISNILDLTYLVDRIFRGGPPPPACP